MAEKNALAAIDTDAILERIAAGEFASHIAPELGCSKQALYVKLAGAPGYREALAAGQEARLQKIIGQFEALGLAPPPPRPIKPPKDAPPELQDAHAAELERFKSDNEAWRAGCTVNEFELSRLEKLWRAESWRAERAHPEKWASKAHLHLTGEITLDQLLTAVDAEVAPIEGESVAVANPAAPPVCSPKSS